MEFPTQHIQERICYHENEAALWRKKLNARSSINKLPNEILALIFACCLPQTWREPSSNFDLFRGLSMVCSIWREVALNTPALYGVLPCITTKQTNWAWHYAKGAPLKLTFRQTDLNSDTKLAMAWKILDMARVHTLKIDCSPAQFRVLRDLLDRDAPILHRMSIHLSDYPNLDIIPPNLHERATPQLKFLELHNCFWLLDGMYFRQLRSLALTKEVSGGISITQLIRILRDSQHLEEVELIEVLLPLSAAPEPPGDLVCLTHLVRLRIRDSPETVLHVCQNIQSCVLTRLTLELLVSNELGPVEALWKTPLVSEFWQMWSKLFSRLDLKYGYDGYTLIATIEHEYREEPSLESPGVFCFRYETVGDEVKDSMLEDLLVKQAGRFAPTWLRLSSDHLPLTSRAIWQENVPLRWSTIRDMEASGLADEADIILFLIPHVKHLEHLRFTDIDFDLKVDNGRSLRRNFYDTMEDIVGSRHLVVHLRGCSGLRHSGVARLRLKGVDNITWDTDCEEDKWELCREDWCAYSSDSEEDGGSGVELEVD